MEKKVLTEAEVREEMKDILPPGAEVIYMSGAYEKLREQGHLSMEEFIQRLNNVSKNIKRQCGP